MALMRLFFGVPLTAAATLQLEAVMARMGLQHGLQRGWRLLAASNWHITLSFLGDTDGLRLPALIDLGERIAADNDATSVTLDGLHWWPSADRPRLLAAVANDSAPLMPLRKQLNAGLRELGIAFDSKPLRAHVTLLRLERGIAVEDLSVPACTVSVATDELALYVSEKAGREKRYRPLWLQALQAPPPFTRR